MATGENQYVGSSEIPDIVKQFVARYIRTVNDLEVLLLLAGGPKAWSAQEVDEQICLGLEPTGRVLTGLVDSGLVTAREGSPHRYSYDASNSDELAVRDLARIYAQMRVRVIELIYQGPADTLRSFADAFRFRKSGE